MGLSGVDTSVLTFIFGGDAADGAGLKLSLSSAVPEPATWAMMIAGFGLAGAALRSARRRDRQFA